MGLDILSTFKPLVIAEKHNQSDAALWLYHALKKSTLQIDFVLFEGGLTTDSHIDHAQEAFKLYLDFIQNYYSLTDKYQAYKHLLQDLVVPDSELSQYVKGKFDKKKYPHGFGHIQNLSVHFLIYTLLEKQNVAWIPIDSHRKTIKKFAAQKIADGTAKLYKTHHFVGKTSSEVEKIILEAAIIRSKYMADRIYDYACKGQVLALIGCRHAYDLCHYVPDLSVIMGQHYTQDNDHTLYHYVLKNSQIQITPLSKKTSIDTMKQRFESFNSNRIRSSFDLTLDYINFIEKML